MPSLLELHTDTPLSWDELLRRNAEWHARRVVEAVDTVCSRCKGGGHTRCDGTAGFRFLAACICDCNR